MNVPVSVPADPSESLSFPGEALPQARAVGKFRTQNLESDTPPVRVDSGIDDSVSAGP